MVERSDAYPFLRVIFPGAGPELVRLMQGGAENALLLRNDFYAMRDWLEIGKAPEDEALCAILLLLVIALEEGSLCIEAAPTALKRRLLDLVAEPDAAYWTERIMAALEKHHAGLIGTSCDEHRPVIVQQSAGRRFLYFQKYLRAEQAFERLLADRLAGKAPRSTVDWPAIAREVLREQPMQLDPDQVRAITAALSSNLAIISGGPGTGKTSIVLALLQCLLRGGVDPSRIALAAPTGRAAQRLSEALRAGKNAGEMQATTLHQLLAYRPSRHLFARHAENPIPADVVIVDEVSMVGLVLMAQLFEAVEPAAKLILLGDKDQLPAVEAGAVLAHLVPDSPAQAANGALAGRTVVLSTNHRSQADIRAAASAINRQDASLVERLPPLSAAELSAALHQEGGCRFLEQKSKSPGELRGFLQTWIDEAYFHSQANGATLGQLVDAIAIKPGEENADPRALALLRLLDRFRLLTLVRDGPFGCVGINALLEMLVRPRLGAPTARARAPSEGSRSGLFAGAPVLVTRNDPASGLFNGDVGITVRQKGGGLRVLFSRFGGCVSLPAQALPAHELAFALTVHKAQGSEYDNVMLVLPPSAGRRLLTKELIYTGITRAKSLAVICAARDVLQFAIGRKIVRESGLLSLSVESGARR